MLLTEFLWGLGAYFVLVNTTVMSYLRTLGATPILIGTMAMAAMALPLLPQLFGRPLLQRFRRRKKALIGLHIAVIIPYFLIPITDIFLSPWNPLASLVITICLFATSQLLLGLINPVWMDMIAQVFPTHLRGRYFGISGFCLAFGGIIGSGMLIGLQYLLGPLVYRGAFIAAGVFFLASMVSFAICPMPHAAFDSSSNYPSLRHQVSASIRACNPRDNFGRFVLSFMLTSTAMTVSPFLIGYATSNKGLHLPESIFSMMTLFQALGAGLGALTMGWFVDHYGPRVPWACFALLVPIIVLLFPHAGYMPIFLLCSLLMGVQNALWAVGGPSLLELSPPGDKSSFVAIAYMLGFPGTAFGPMLLAFIISGPSGYSGAFMVALIVGVLSFIVALSLKKRETHHHMPA